MDYKSHSMWKRICSYSILAVLLFVMNACSTYTSIFYQQPVTNQDGVTKVVHQNTEYAQITNQYLTIRMNVPRSGSRQQTVGPCLIPIFPYRKDHPKSLIVIIDVMPKPGVTLKITPENWVIKTKERNHDGLFGDIELKKYKAHQVRAVNGPGMNSWQKNKTITNTVQFQLIFPVWDAQFSAFQILNPEIIIQGQKIALPLIKFKTMSRGKYTWYTTKILDIL